MLGVQDIYALRHKVLVEGKSQHRVAREPISRATRCGATSRRRCRSHGSASGRGRCWSRCGRGWSN